MARQMSGSATIFMVGEAGISPSPHPLFLCLVGAGAGTPMIHHHIDLDFPRIELRLTREMATPFNTNRCPKRRSRGDLKDVLETPCND
jgi:hypothetical protein